MKAGLGGIAFGLAAYAVAVLTFGWSARELLVQLVLAESHSGFQLDLIPGVAVVMLVLWWPFLLLCRPGIGAAGQPARLVMAAGAVSALYMLKQGTFFNVLDPLEPFLAVAAVAGGQALWQRNERRARALVIVCAFGAAIHIASVSSASLSRALPMPARRHEPAHTADWFILEALQRYCGGSSSRTQHCDDWSRVKALARDGRIPVVSVDSNIVSFDASFRADTGVASMRRLLSVQKPPIKTTVFSR